MGKKINPDDLISKLVKAKDNAPDTVDLWNKVVQTFGGQDKFAVAAKKIFDACEAGSAQQVRMMSMFMDLCRAASAATEKTNPADDMSNDELSAAINHLFRGKADDAKARESDD